MGFSAAKIAPSPPYTPPGTIETRKGFGSTIRHGRSAPSHRVTCFARAPACAPRCANAYAVFRSCALRVLAPSALRASDGQRPGRECIFTHSSQSSIHIARKACLWLLLLTGLTSACFRHRRRPPCAPQKMPEMTYTPSFLIKAPFFPYFVNTLGSPDSRGAVGASRLRG